MGGYYPSRHCRWYPSMPCSRSQGGAIPACIAGGIPACLAAGLQGKGSAPVGVPGPRGGLLLGDAWSRGCLVWEVCPGGCLVEAPRDGYCCGGTHPTRMHSCLEVEFTKNLDCYKLSLLTIFISFSRLLNSSMIILYLQQ